MGKLSNSLFYFLWKEGERREQSAKPSPMREEKKEGSR